MQSIDLSKKHIVNISIYNRNLEDDIFQDFRFVQLMNMLIKTSNKHSYSYCFYCDHCGLKTNLFIPIFHTMYLACQNNNVLIKNHKDLWLIDTFKNNKYFILKDKNDEFDYSESGVLVIDNIVEIERLSV